MISNHGSGRKKEEEQASTNNSSGGGGRERDNNADHSFDMEEPADLLRRQQRQSNNKEWGLMQIVESAESKLMRKRARPLAKLQLLKSPAFAKNTLDEQDLDRLAREPARDLREKQTIQKQVESIQRVSDCALEGAASNKLQRGCCSSTTNMINRRQQDEPRNGIGTGIVSGGKWNGTRKPLGQDEEDLPENEDGREIQSSGETEPSIGDKASGGHSFELDLAEDERGGPTPTNDLIRALIQRDRAALQSEIKSPRNVSGSGSGSNSASLVSSVNCCNTNAKPKSGGPRIRDEQLDQRCRQQQQTMELAEVGQQRAAPLTSGKKRGNNDTSSTREDSELMTTTSEANSAAAAAAANQQLPEMIQQKLNLTTAAGLGTRCGTTKQVQDELRRHSIYMLPLVLKKRELQATDSDDDDDTTDNSNSSSSSAGSLEDDSDNRLELLMGSRRNNQSDIESDTEEREEGKTSTKSGATNQQMLLLQSSKLRMSASSPSALSTPTNLDPGGCGGSCCRNNQQAPSAGATSRQTVARRHRGSVNLQPPKLSPPLSARLPKSLMFESPSSRQRRYSLAPVLAQQQELQEQRRQKRISSNPLDRFRLVGSGTTSLTLTGGCCSNQQRQNLVNQAFKNACCGSGGSGGNNAQQGKRHSIISGSQLVSKLSLPRSLFSTHNNSINLQQKYQQQRGSMECGMNNNNQQQYNSCSGAGAGHYDPLIPESGFKIVVMGTSGSGKTSIIQRFMYNSFNWRHNPTVEDTYFIEFPHMKNVINISISDTSGTYQFPAMRRLAINSGDAFILVYSVDDPQSFDDLEQLRQTILDEREQAYLEACASITSDNSSTSGLASTATNATTTTTGTTNYSSSLISNYSNPHYTNVDQPTSIRESVSPRHWSLASIFNSHTQQNQQHCLNNSSQIHHSSLNSSMCSSSCSSSADNSRRSSISAAEAALKTRRTRRPPMVIVANKHDLPAEQHLVNSDEIEALAVIDWNNGFVRASAAMNLNIDEIFQQVLKQAKQPPTLTEAIVSKRRKSLPPKLPNSGTNYNSFRKDLY